MNHPANPLSAIVDINLDYCIYLYSAPSWKLLPKVRSIAFVSTFFA